MWALVGRRIESGCVPATTVSKLFSRSGSPASHAAIYRNIIKTYQNPAPSPCLPRSYCRMRSQLFLSLAALVLLSNPVLASSGDRANDFQRCAARCESQTCASDVDPIISFLDTSNLIAQLAHALSPFCVEHTNMSLDPPSTNTAFNTLPIEVRLVISIVERQSC